MKKVTVNTSKKYNILLGSGLIEDIETHLARVTDVCKICVVSDGNVNDLYGKKLRTSLESAGHDVCVFAFEAGEKSKNMTTVSKLLEFMAEKQLTRTDIIVAFGGGVVGDIAGFAASCYLRGIRFIQIPTTLLAAVDSSVGGKTGVNITAGKNLVGAFWQPSLVLCDHGLFKSLKHETLLEGIAEVIKYGVIADEELFDLMARACVSELFNDNLFEHIIEKCVKIKSEIVSRDERDMGERQLLNFGHTLGHAIEKCSNYEISHGHAVAIGMLCISRAAYEFGLSPKSCYVKIEQALKQHGFVLTCDYSAEELYEAALIDKKRTGNFITLILPDKIGSCRLEKVDITLFREFVRKGI